MCMQLALHQMYINKGCKNVSHKNKKICQNGAVCLLNTSVPTWKKQLQENVRGKEGHYSMQQPMQINILWLCFHHPYI